MRLAKSVLVVVFVSILLIASFIIATNQYSAPVGGHTGQQIDVNGITLDDALTQLAGRLGNLQSGDDGPATSAFNFYAKISRNDVTGQNYGVCQPNEVWTAHIHTTNTGFISANGVTAQQGWLALCSSGSDAENDIITIISQNGCQGGTIDQASCPSGYTQVASIFNNVGGCNANTPTLSSTSGKTISTGTLLICQKGASNYKISYSPCGAGQTALGNFENRIYFCKSNDGNAIVDVTSPADITNDFGYYDYRDCYDDAHRYMYDDNFHNQLLYQNCR